MKRICLIYNYAHHYRTNIFTLMDKEFPIDFYFGDKYLDVKKMDYSLLINYKYEVKNKTFIKKPLYFQKGVLKLLFNRDYKLFLMLGEYICASTWLMLLFSKLFRKRIYLWSHGWYGKETKIREIIIKIFFSMAEGIFLYGNYAKQLMIEKGFDETKLHVVYNSLSYDQQIILRNHINKSNIYFDKFNNNNKNLIFVGRLTKIKKLDLLIEALNILNLGEKYFNLTFIGEGEEMDNLIDLTKRFNLQENIWFFGASYDENELSNLIYNADLCVSPGNVGLTAIHAMTYGTPVITHNYFEYQMPEFEAIIENQTGAFFTYNNSSSLAKVIEDWFLNNPNRERVRQSCYNIIDNHYNPHFQVDIFKENLK